MTKQKYIQSKVRILEEISLIQDLMTLGFQDDVANGIPYGRPGEILRRTLARLQLENQRLEQKYMDEGGELSD